MDAARRLHPHELRWALVPPTPDLAARVGALEAHLRLAQAELHALGEEATWMIEEAAGALDLAVGMLVDELAPKG